jgi:hypothetical protein
MCQTTEKSDKDNEIQCLPAVTFGGLIASAINGIVAYVAVYFFKPLWQRLTKFWEKE